MISRAERTTLSDWAWTVDHWLLASIALLIVCGLVFSLAGSPAVAERLHLSTFHFVNRQVMYLAPALVVMIAVSFLSPRHVRRAALALWIVSLALVVATLFFGARGERRAALDLRRAAVGISEAGLRHRRRLGVFGRRQAQGCSRQPARHRHLADHRHSAGDAAGHRPDHADLAGLGGPVVHGGNSLVLDRRHRRRRRDGGGRRL